MTSLNNAFSRQWLNLKRAYALLALYKFCTTHICCPNIKDEDKVGNEIDRLTAWRQCREREFCELRNASIAQCKLRAVTLPLNLFALCVQFARVMQSYITLTVTVGYARSAKHCTFFKF
jgi:hypothetical protein